MTRVGVRVQTTLEGRRQEATTRQADFSAWYNELVLRSELEDYSPVAGAWSFVQTATASGSG